MMRVMASFLVGLLVGSGALFLAGRAFLMIAEGPELTAANERGMSLPEYQKWVDGRYETPFLLFSLIGGLMCAWCCAYAAWRSETAAAAPSDSSRLARPDEAVATVTSAPAPLASSVR